jgi:hypothetical protein
MSTLKMRYTDEHGTVSELEFDGSRTEEIMDRCAAKFCSALTAADHVRFAAIVKRWNGQEEGK